MDFCRNDRLKLNLTWDLKRVITSGNTMFFLEKYHHNTAISVVNSRQLCVVTCTRLDLTVTHWMKGCWGLSLLLNYYGVLVVAFFTLLRCHHISLGFLRRGALLLTQSWHMICSCVSQSKSCHKHCTDFQVAIQYCKWKFCACSCLEGFLLR